MNDFENKETELPSEKALNENENIPNENENIPNENENISNENENISNEKNGSDVKTQLSAEENTKNIFAGENSFKFDREAEKRYEKKSSGLWKTVGIISLAVILAFSGAFFGMAWACQTSILGDSKFFEALVLSNSGVKVNRVDVDYISGQYQPTDSTTLAEKVLAYTVSIEARIYDEVTKEYSEPSNGSGVVIGYDESTGYATVITNHHVVYGSNHFRVIMNDGTVYQGELQHLDDISDLAMVRIKTNKEVPCAAVADSSKAVYGQQIAVCGNPLGYNASISFGYVSCPSRELTAENDNYIQIDASVNPGNSGGGLYDAQGNLLGIVVSKASGSNVDGIGFAIPSNRMLDVMSDLLQFGYVKGRPALGVTVATVNAASWDYFNNGDLSGFLEKYKYGVYVMSSKYYPDLILKGDRLVSIDGAELTTKEQVSYAIMKHKAGDKIKIKLERKNEDGSLVIKEITVTLKERDWADENQVG